jgi:hypothetical protein
MGGYPFHAQSIPGGCVRQTDRQALDYEPFEILAEMLSNSHFTDRMGEKAFFNAKDKPGAIGGAPQALKIYQHANVRPIAVRWPLSHNSTVTLFGRPLFEWEMTLNPIYDPATRTFYYPLGDIRNTDPYEDDKKALAGCQCW